jgi:hypothetical protein
LQRRTVCLTAHHLNVELDRIERSSDLDEREGVTCFVDGNRPGVVMDRQFHPAIVRS